MVPSTSDGILSAARVVVSYLAPALVERAPVRIGPRDALMINRLFDRYP